MNDPHDHRHFLKGNLWEGWEELETDQRKQIPPPPVQKPYPEDAPRIKLVAAEDLSVGTMPLLEAINRRRSRRTFTGDPLTGEDLSFLLWVTQGIQRVVGEGRATLRTVPSGGARHPFETYLMVLPGGVEDLDPGLYRYLPLEHALGLLDSSPGVGEQVIRACRPGHRWVENSAVIFVWTAIPYRTEWRYSVLSAKIIAQDSGHLCQNLYLASEAIGAGTCAIGAYNQALMDAALGVDGIEEFAVYIAPVGKIA
jgi:SagB-type dehydrogenase family enzyme